MSLAQKIMPDLKAAMKARDEIAKNTLRLLKSELTKKEVDLGRELDEAEEMSMLLSAVKSRKDSIALYEEGGREDLAAQEKAEITVLERYLPKGMSDEEAAEAVKALASELSITEKKDMGKLMQAIMAKHRGVIDGKLASKLAAQLLS